MWDTGVGLNHRPPQSDWQGCGALPTELPVTLAITGGLEPPTNWLTASYSTN